MGRLLRALREVFAPYPGAGKTGSAAPYGLATEAAWLTCATPWPMLDVLEDRLSERKRRLFTSACCRRVWPLLDDRVHQAVERNEAAADGLAAPADLEALLADLAKAAAKAGAGRPRGRTAILYAAAEETLRSNPYTASTWLSTLVAFDAVGLPPDAELTARQRLDARWQAAEAQAQREQTDLLRDLFTSPFHPVSFDPAWRTPTVQALARSVYEERDFGRLAVLADALSDAGCTEPVVLGHCRSTAGHVRGCWVLDGLSDREGISSP